MISPTVVPALLMTSKPLTMPISVPSGSTTGMPPYPLSSKTRAASQIERPLWW